MDCIRIIMAGNPNVGKSTLFNHFTGSKQHTGNWPGKTVGSALAYADHRGRELIITDTPGTYSLHALSADEEQARDSILFETSDCIIVVCDACCAERSIFPALQIMETKENVVVCLNLMDEANARGISIDIPLLERRLGCPVIGVSATKKENLNRLLDAAVEKRTRIPKQIMDIRLQEILQPLADYFDAYRPPLPSLWLANQIASGDESMLDSLSRHLGLDINDRELSAILEQTRQALRMAGFDPENLLEISILAIKARAAEICDGAIQYSKKVPKDLMLGSPIITGFAMTAMLFLVLWLSIFAAEYPGQLMTHMFDKIGNALIFCLEKLRIYPKLISLLMEGVYGTLTTVISVMLPPMAVFFPLFSVLEDWGFLPRLAFNMDGYFKKCGGCGKQALTMCMGLGCNTVGINGCKIIGSPKEKATAVLTNSFMPCNGRFPMLIAISSYLFRNVSSPWSTILAALSVMAAILLGILGSMAASALLSSTTLKGITSAFVLEIPPLRRPQFLQTIKRSMLNRTLFVLWRALKFAAPAGMVIWLLANIKPGGDSLLFLMSRFFDPAAKLIGLDGAILLAFILGLPASEIILPIILMCYLSTGTVSEISQSQLTLILSKNGWDTVRAICMMIFTVFHWPCISSLAAIRDELGKWKYVFLGAVLPATFGILLCAIVNLI